LKFQPDHLDGVNVVAAFAPGKIIVNAQPWSGSVIVPWHGQVQAWPPSLPDELDAAHFATLLPFAPEVVIYGSGPSLRFPPSALMRPLIDARIGFETMDSGAACRTYNVLVTEGRRALLAVLV
jgi:uncharacterized protein